MRSNEPNKIFFVSCSKLKSDREKRNSDESFTPEEVIITRSSFTKENTWEVEFVVLSPVSNGKPPKGIPFDEVIKMLEESKDGIQKDLRGSIESITHKEVEHQPKKTPLQGAFKLLAILSPGFKQSINTLDNLRRFHSPHPHSESGWNCKLELSLCRALHRILRAKMKL